MKKPASVHVDIAEFSMLVMEMEHKERADWLLSLVKCLAYNNPNLNEYGAKLLNEVKDFRESEKARKEKYKDTERHGKTRKDTESVERHYRADRADRADRAEQTDIKKEISSDSKESSDTKKKVALVEKPDSIPAHIWQDFLTLRKSKKAPVTKTALRMIEKSADAANLTLLEAILICINFSWITFTGEYYKNSKIKIDSFLFDIRSNKQ